MRHRRRVTGVRLRTVLLLALATLAAIAPASPANAIASVGASQECDDYGHCVTGSAFSSNSDTDVFDAGLGTAIAGCKGGANGSTLIVVTCTIGDATRTASFPGTAGIVAMATDTSTLDRVPVCWTVVAYFPNLSGKPYDVPVDGCALLVL